MELQKEEEDTVEVRFVTHLDEYRVTETPFRVLLKFGRFGLSGVINHLLALDPPKPFDFLIGNEFLRTTLQEFLRERNLSVESTLIIQYIEAITEPEPEKDFKHDDWVSSVDASLQGFYLTGCYDGVARLWNDQGKCLVSCSGHSGAIRSIARVPNDLPDGVVSFVTGSKDHTVRVWHAHTKGDSFANTYLGKGHSGAVESVSVSPASGGSLKFCSASWDKSIKIWDVEGAQSVVLPSGKKKRKLETQEMSPVVTLEGHTQCVSSVQWISEDRILSGSWDHSIKQWDPETGTTVDTLHGGKVVCGLAYQKDLKLVASAHSDRVVRVWDLRSKDASLVMKNLSSHQEWVTSVAWHPQTENFLISGSHDSTVKFWDIRSVVPLHTLSAADKVLCAAWAGNDKIVGGGSDCKLNVWKMKN